MAKYRYKVVFLYYDNKECISFCISNDIIKAINFL